MERKFPRATALRQNLLNHLHGSVPTKSTINCEPLKHIQRIEMLSEQRRKKYFQVRCMLSC
jgi:hypothetical protein